MINASSPIIQVTHLTKHFSRRNKVPGLRGLFQNLLGIESGTVHAVDGISFAIQPGELVGYLGPNGAGKSTTLKMLTGLLVPTSGELRVFDYLPWKDRQTYVARIGAVFGQRSTLWWDLPVRESLELLQHIYRIPPPVFKRNLGEFRALLALDEFIETPVRALSLGQRMRADLCAALLHNPEILFLDEPTIGLDVVAKERIRQFIQFINQERGVTVLLTTHDLADVEKLCERVLIIDHGKLLYDGSLSWLQTRFGGHRLLIVELAEPYSDVTVDGAQVVEHTGLQVVYAFERATLTASDLIGRLSVRFRLRDLQVREPEIEGTIRRIYEERLLESPPAPQVTELSDE